MSFEIKAKGFGQENELKDNVRITIVVMKFHFGQISSAGLV